MKKLTNKVIAILLIITLVGISFVSDVVFATNLVLMNVAEQTEVSNQVNENDEKNIIESGVNTSAETTSGTNISTKTTSNPTENTAGTSTETTGEEIDFLANINGSNNVVADINQELVVNFKIHVKKSGYLKDVHIDLSDGNYVISRTVDEINEKVKLENPNISKTKLIKAINGNVIYLNEIDEGDTLEINIPIKYNKAEMAVADDYNKESKAVLKGTYVNSRVKGREIEETVTQRIQWKANAESTINQKLVRYLKYNERTIVSFEITEGIKENKIPAMKKEINITVPKLNEELPAHVIATGENAEQQYNDGILTITKESKPNEQGRYNYETEDKYTVTYIYNNQTESAVIETMGEVKTTTIAGTELTAQTEKNQYEVNAEVGSIVGLQVGIPQEINKGYMYTNLNRKENKLDTNYNEVYRINIGYAELTDKIKVTEDRTTLNDENGNVLADINNEIKTKKVSVAKDELTTTLGEEGRIIVRNENEEVIGELNKDVQELNIEANKLTFETSKPVKEGDIRINLEKQILGDADLIKETLKQIKELSSDVIVSGYNEDREISKSTIKGTIGLTNPSSKGSVETNIDTLSTVTKNENVVFNIVLDRTDIGDALYTNPAVRITLPSQVSNIEVTSAKVVYDEELNAGDIQVNGNEIIIQLQGTQTQYNTLETTKGTLIRVVTNLGLDYLLPSSIENVKVELYNEATEELNTVEKQVKIVAPNDFIRTHEITIDDESRQAIDNDVDTIKIKANESAKTMQVSGQVINNLGYTAEGFSILGRLPFEGNKTIGGQDLGSTINASLASPIEVEGLEGAIVYYSSNGEETLEGSNWTIEPISNAKSFKIKSNAGLNDKQLVRFKYSVTIPENLEYEKVGKFNYGIYYNNNAQNGKTTNLIEAKALGFETGIAPTIRAGVIALDTNEGYTINDGDSVKEGQYITYRVKVANIGDFDINNIVIKATLPEGISLVRQYGYNENTPGDFVTTSTKELTQEVGTIAGGQSETYEFTAQVSQVMSSLSEEEKDAKSILGVNFDITSDTMENRIGTTFSVKNNNGGLNLKLATDNNYLIDLNEEISYKIKLANSNNDNKDDVNVRLELPEGIKYTGIDSTLKNKVKYDERSNTVNINLGTLNSLANHEIRIQAVNVSNKSQELTTRAVTTCRGIEEETKSNIVKFLNESGTQNIKASQTVNNVKNVTDSDEIEFYIDITNEGSRERKVVIEDEIQQELAVDEYVTTINGNIVDQGATNYIRSIATISAGDTAKITIKAKAYPKEQGTIVNITNKPTITTENDEIVDINAVYVNATGTAQEQTDELVEEGTLESSEISEELQTHKISGKVWFDENKNGKKDLNENGMQGIVVQLYDVKNNQVAKDSEDNDLTMTTNNIGEYSFLNLKQEEYIVVAKYENVEYEVTNYKADEVEESINSDFVNAKLGNDEVAATDNVKTIETNTYNIDLGLIKREQFNLGLEESISKITIATEKNGTRVIGYDTSEADLNLSNDELKNSTILVEYNMKISNNGNVAGYAKSIMNHIPKGIVFNSEINPDWYLSKDGNLYTTDLGDDIIQPGESKDIKLVLTKQLNDGQMGLMRVRSEIDKTYNEKGIEPISALTGNYKNISASDVVILKQSEVSIVVVIGMSIVIIGLIGIAGYEIKKRYIDKLYEHEDLNL